MSLDQDDKPGVKGLEISRRFFAEWGLPWLQREWPDLVGRMAAGKIGGSDIIGADDEWSRDHDWGPCFSLWLTREDHRRIGRRLQWEINAAAPREFMGARHQFFGQRKDNIGVESIDACIAFHTGIATPPARRARLVPPSPRSVNRRKRVLALLPQTRAGVLRPSRGIHRPAGCVRPLSQRRATQGHALPMRDAVVRRGL